MRHALAFLVAASLAAASIAGTPQRASALPAACGPIASAALAGLGYGLSSTWGSGSHPENRHVLAAMLHANAALRACGDERDSISAELIEADAYSDVDPDRPQLRCNALRDARKRLYAIHDVARAQMVTKTLADCR